MFANTETQPVFLCLWMEIRRAGITFMSTIIHSQKPRISDIGCTVVCIDEAA